MPHIIQQDYQQQTDSSDCCPGLSNCCVGDAGLEFTLEKVIHSSSRQVSSNSTLTTRGVTWAQGFSAWHTDASHFALVDSSRVVSTRSGSSNGVNDLVINLNRHAVARFDSFDLMPADSNFAQHVGDSDSFIIDDNLWSKEQHIGSQSNRSTDCCNFDESISTANNEIVGKDSEAQENSETEKYIVTSRAIGNSVTHSRIMTHISNRGSKEALA